MMRSATFNSTRRVSCEGVQERECERLGSHGNRQGTARRLGRPNKGRGSEATAAGTFREDLIRLNVFNRSSCRRSRAQDDLMRSSIIV